MATQTAHRPVLLSQACELLLRSSAGLDGVYVDATFGRGGHAAALLAQLSPQGRVIGLDRDPQAIEAGQATFGDESRLHLVHTRFGRLAEAAKALGFERVDGVLMDLGVSSPQLDQPERGFSFMHDGPLDMRMDNSKGLTAMEWLAAADERAITRVLREYGEEPQARRLARVIVTTREQRGAIETTGQLAALVSATLGRRDLKRHPATRTFQALRMAVNSELGELDEALKEMQDLLADGGVLAVISFHSLEDRMVKQFIRNASRVDPKLARLPVVPADALPSFETLGRAVRPGPEEVAANPRARSAVLRGARRLPRPAAAAERAGA